MAERGVKRITVAMHSQAQHQYHEYYDTDDDKKPSLLSTIAHEEPAARLWRTEPLQAISKRKRLKRTQLKEVKAAARHAKRCLSSCKGRSNNLDRWSKQRYKLAEQSMLEIFKAEGATFKKPISRPALKTAARKWIGDTGLLDHLLKHIDGKMAPGGAERFRHWFNPKGFMEYWLENADLDSL